MPFLLHLQQSETLNYTNMDGEQKIYAAPLCEVIEMEVQGMIAMSGPEDPTETPWNT